MIGCTQSSPAHQPDRPSTPASSSWRFHPAVNASNSSITSGVTVSQSARAISSMPSASQAKSLSTLALTSPGPNAAARRPCTLSSWSASVQAWSWPLA